MKKFGLVLLFLAMVFAAAAALFVGKFSLSADEYLRAFSDDIASVIVWQIRLPRVLAALAIGAALGASGAVYQAMFANPLVSPGVLGVLAGAGFGAALGMVLGGFEQVLAFVCGCTAVVVAGLIAASVGHSQRLMLILGGVISAAIFSALLSVVKYFADTEEALPEIVYFLMGSLSFSARANVYVLGVCMLACVILMCLMAQKINALSLGDEQAKSLGVDVRKLKICLILLATAASSLSVILGGIIGWIGLIAPHICRFIFGADNRLLMPAASMFGALFLLLCDSLSRGLYSYEIPIGVITSLLGILVFLAVLLRSKN